MAETSSLIPIRWHFLVPMGSQALSQAPSPLTRTTVWQHGHFQLWQWGSRAWDDLTHYWASEWEKLTLILQSKSVRNGPMLSSWSLCLLGPRVSAAHLQTPQPTSKPLSPLSHPRHLASPWLSENIIKITQWLWENTKWYLCALKISLCEPGFEVNVPLGKEGRNNLEHLHIYWQSKNTRICLY